VKINDMELLSLFCVFSSTVLLDRFLPSSFCPEECQHNNLKHVTITCSSPSSSSTRLPASGLRTSTHFVRPCRPVPHFTRSVSSVRSGDISVYSFFYSVFLLVEYVNRTSYFGFSRVKSRFCLYLFNTYTHLSCFQNFIHSFVTDALQYTLPSS
jgi:hypothetical protein